MNILFICDEYPPAVHGGIGAATKVLAEELAAEGHAVIVAGFYPPYRGGNAHEEINGVHVYRFTYGRGGLLPWGLRRLIPLQYRYPSIAREFRQYTEALRQLVSRHNIDIIEIPDYNEVFFNAQRAALEFPDLGAPLVVKTHGSYTFLYEQKKQHVPPSVFRNESALYARASGIIAVSRFSSDAIGRLFRLPEGTPREVIYNGIRMPGRVHAEKEKQVVFAGSLVKTKGIHQLMKAWNIVATQQPGIMLEVCGKGSAAAIRELEELLDREVRPSVNFRGHVNRNELLELFSRSAIAVFPSYFENFSMVPLESMSRECATIYTNRASGKEVIDDGKDGLLVDPDNEESIARAILNLLQDNSKRKMLAAAGAARVKKDFSLENIAARHIRFYTSILKSPQIQPG